MNSSKDKFDPKLLKNLDFDGNEDLIRELEWFLSDLKDELRTALTTPKKSRAKQLATKIDEVQSKINQLMKTAPSTPVTSSITEANEPVVLKRKPPAAEKNAQFDLFRQFTTNYENDVSNSLETWDLIPKYFATVEQAKLRDTAGLPLPAQWQYTDRDGNSEVTFSVTINPTIMMKKVKKGDEKVWQQQVCFPGPTEEIIEEVLKKFLLDQQLGSHHPTIGETWVRFTLNMIQRELAARGKSRSNIEIRQSLILMSQSTITWIKQGKATYIGHIISDLIGVSREDYEDGSTMWAARLTPLISSAINSLKYRQFNYSRFFKLNESLSRWINRRLIIKYKQASPDNPYTVHFKTIKQLSALLQQQDDRGNRKKVISALEELKKAGVLSSYEAIDIKSGRQIIDVKYILIPSDTFVAEQKAANKRAFDADCKDKLEGIKLE